MLACAVLTGGLVNACGEDQKACTDIYVFPVTAFIENGAYEGDCAYEVSFTNADGTAPSFECWIEDTNCICPGGGVGRNTVSLVGRYLGETRVLDTREVVVEEDECHPINEEVTFEQPPIDEFLVESCVDAVANLTSCDRGYLILPTNCTDTTVEAGEVPGSEATNCTYSCIADADCDTIVATICPDGGAGDAGGGAGGMGGTAGDGSEPSSLVECAVACDPSLGTEDEAAAGAAVLCPVEE